MVVWLWTRLDAAPAESFFKYWIVGTVVLDTLSLVVDASHVIRYVRGERNPQGEPPSFAQVYVDGAGP